jgi:glycosyltransferase involved in cell wall biosynthesis
VKRSVDDMNRSQSDPKDRPETRLGPRPPLRVAYDAQAFLSANGGTGKGVQLRNLLGPHSNDFIGFATKGQNYSDRSLIQGGFSTYQLWQQFSLPYLLHKWKADFFLAPYNIAPLMIPKRTKLILVLHDLILLQASGKATLKQRVNDRYRRYLVPKSVSQAHIVLTVSFYTKQQIGDRFPSARVEVIPCSIPSSWFVDRSARNLDERGNYILLVTSSAPHKNTIRALEAYAKLVAVSDRSTVPRLRIVGLSSSREVFRLRTEALQIGELVNFEPYLAENQLQELYRGAKAVLIPSLMEGFGIPVLEAMASGTPVVSSHAASLPEVGGLAAAYFDPYDVDEMAATLSRILGSRARQEEMIDLGLRRAGRFHPDVVSRQVQAFWTKLAVPRSADQASLAKAFQE